MRRVVFAAMLVGAAVSFSSCQFVDRLVGISIGKSSVVAPIPATPSFPTISNPTSTSLTVVWSVVNGSGGYSVYRASAASGPYQEVAEVTGTIYTDTGLLPSAYGAYQVYYYRISAWDSSGDSGLSQPASGVTSSAKISAPTGFAATSVTSTSVTLSWNTVAGGVTYTAYRSSSPVLPNPPTTLTGIPLSSLDSSSVQATDNGVSPGTTYYYIVQVVDSSGNPSLSPILKVTTPP